MGFDNCPRSADLSSSTAGEPAAGLDAGFHSLRHFCATTLLRRGVSVAAVARTLGNTPATVMDHYAHWITDDADLVRDVLDWAFDVDNGDNVAPLLGA